MFNLAWVLGLTERLIGVIPSKMALLIELFLKYLFIRYGTMTYVIGAVVLWIACLCHNGNSLIQSWTWPC